MRILVVEDDRPRADVLRRGFAEDGHVVDVAYDGPEGETAAAGGANPRHSATLCAAAILTVRGTPDSARRLS